MNKLVLCVLPLLLQPAAWANSYSTSFPLTENPISESGKWINGGTTGVGWTNVRTTPGFAFGTMSGTAGFPQQYGDSTAVLSGSWGPDQIASAVVAAPNPASGGQDIFEEVEVRLRTTITANSITGYEVNCSVISGSEGNYIQIVRWNGALGSFTQLNGASGHCSTGDVLKGTITGSTINVYLNGTFVESATDSTFTSGAPGIGFFLQGANGLDANYGFSSVTLSDTLGSQIPQPVNFGNQAVGSTSSALSANFTIAAGTTVGSIAVLTTGISGKDFTSATGSTCTARTYSTTTNCTVKAKFTPAVAGLRKGAVVLLDGSGNVIQQAPLYGVGTGPQIIFGPGGAQANVGSGFSNPKDASVDAAGNVFVADFNNAAVYKVAPGGAQTSVGSGFTSPAGVAVDGAGNIFVADPGGPAVYEVKPDGTQTTVGSGFIDPVAVASDGAGNVYIADYRAPAVYEVTPAGAQSAVGSGFVDPAGVAVDGTGNVYVADAGAPAVYKIAPGGAQSTVGSGFAGPDGVAVDAAGDVYVADSTAAAVYEVASGGAQATVGSGFSSPTGLAVDGSGNLIVADTGLIAVVKIDRADAPSLSFASTPPHVSSSDSPKSVNVENIGTQSLNFNASGGVVLTDASDYSLDTSQTYDCVSGTALGAGASCVLSVSFVPSASGALPAAITLTDNSLNAASAQQSIALTGTGLAASTLTSPAQGSVFPGPSVNFTWSAVTGATGYYLLIGSTGAGSSDLLHNAETTGTSYTFTAVPTNGETIYARLITDFNGTWASNDYTFTAATQAALTSPAAGSTLSGPSVAFTWSAGVGATAYQLWIGSTGVNSNNVYSSGSTTATTVTPNNLPTNGETLYVRVYTSFNGVWTHADYTYTAATYIQAALTSPAPASTLAGPSVTFTWTAGTGATSYQLWLGSTGVNTNNLYSSGATSGTSVTANNLPTNGSTIYARLYVLIGSVWSHYDYTYTAATYTQAAITSPAPGSTLTGPSVTFTWTAGTGATSYQLWLGSTGVNTNNLYSSGVTSGTSVTANNLPTNGSTIYARLYVLIGSVWSHYDYTYTAATYTQAAITSPAPGSTLTGPSVTFTWTAGTGATSYQLWLGSTGVNTNNLYSSGATSGTSVTANNLPTNGITIYARLYVLIGSVWSHYDYTYTAATYTPAAITSPAPGSTLTGPSVTFNWTAGTGATSYQLWLGSTGVNTNNLYSSGVTSGTSVTANNLPTNGTTIYARLYVLIGSVWSHYDYTYTAASGPSISSPAPGSTLTASSVTFTWSPGSLAVTSYQLWLGSTGVNTNDLYSSGATTVTSVTANHLPTNGETVYARLYFLVNGAWGHVDSTYTAYTAP